MVVHIYDFKMYVEVCLAKYRASAGLSWKGRLRVETRSAVFVLLPNLPNSRMILVLKQHMQKIY